MSQNNIPTPSIERLLQRVITAERSQQKEVRITVQEAKDLSYELALMTVSLSKTVHEIHRLLGEIKESNNNIDVRFDGGTL